MLPLEGRTGICGMTVLAASKPARFSQRIVRLLDQQFWRWGCDVKHAGGNLLVRFGFRRIPPPTPGEPKTSVYVLEIDPSIRIVLRGSAAFYGNDQLGGLLIKRFDSQPYRTPQAYLEELPHTPDCLPAVEPFQKTEQQCRKLASELFHWTAQYEAWINSECGVQYVEQSLKLWGKRPAVEASASESRWLELADEVG